jgi:hypothetical protein
VIFSIKHRHFSIKYGELSIKPRELTKKKAFKMVVGQVSSVVRWAIGVAAFLVALYRSIGHSLCVIFAHI